MFELSVCYIVFIVGSSKILVDSLWSQRRLMYNWPYWKLRQIELNLNKIFTEPEQLPPFERKYSCSDSFIFPFLCILLLHYYKEKHFKTWMVSTPLQYTFHFNLQFNKFEFWILASLLIITVQFADVYKDTRSRVGRK